MSSCVSVPDHVVCQLSLSDNGANCALISKPRDVYFVPLRDLDGYIMRAPRDEQKLIEYVKKNCMGPKK